MLRYLTAGESHGRALVVIVEGLPAGLLGVDGAGAERAGPSATRLRAWAPHALRAGRGHDHRRRPPRPHPRIAGRHRGRQQRVGSRPGQVAEGDVRAGRGRPHAGAAHPGPSRARRPGRHAEVRARRRTRHPRAGLGTRDGSPRRRRHGGQGAAGRARGRRRSATSSRWARPAPRRPTRPAPGDLAAGRRVGRALLRPRGRGGHGRGDQGGRQGRRQPRRHRRGARLRRACGLGQPRALGPQARRPARPGAHVDPGREGRGDRRRVRRRRAAGERRPRSRSRGTRRPGPTGASPRSPVASRAASPPASCSWPAPP